MKALGIFCYRLFSWFAVAWLCLHLILIRLYGTIWIGEPNNLVINAEVVMGLIAVIGGGIFTYHEIKKMMLSPFPISFAKRKSEAK